MTFKIKTDAGQTRWEVRFRKNGRGSGEMRRRFKTRDEAETFLHSFKARKSETKNSFVEVRDFEETTFKKESEYWMNLHKDQLSPGYLYRVQGILKELWREYGSFPPNRFHPAFLTSMQSEFLSRGLKPATVNRKTNVITSILNCAARQLRIPYNPAAKFKQLKEKRDDMKCWSEADAISFLTFASKKYPWDSPKRWIYVVYLFAINAGVRAGEIWGLKSKDIIEHGEVIHIQRQFDITDRIFRPTKGKENRRVPCNKDLSEELSNLIQKSQIEGDQTVFQASNGKPIQHDNFIFRIFKPDLKEWHGKAVRFHDLRHTAITLMISKGVDLKTVQEIAGHKDIKTTMNYVHLVAEKIKQTARLFSVVPNVTQDPEDPSHPNLRLIHSI